MNTPVNGASKWLLGLFAAVLLFLMARTFDAMAAVSKANSTQDQEILRLQIADSLQTAAMHDVLRILGRVEDKVDSILHPPRYAGR